jgi:hypothetical protein
MSGLNTGISSSSLGSRSTRGGSGSQSISNTNPFSTYYINPMSLGLGSTTTGRGGGGFTQPLYGTISTTTGGTATLSGSSVNSNSPVGGTSMGMNRQMYGVNMGIPGSASAGQLVARPDLQNVIARSTSLPSRGDIRVAMDGDVVVLQGAVQDEHERRLAETMLRFTPGVREVRNELTPRQPSQGPSVSP